MYMMRYTNLRFIIIIIIYSTAKTIVIFEHKLQRISTQLVYQSTLAQADNSRIFNIVEITSDKVITR